MEKKIQNIVLPTNEKFQMQWQLFYKGNNGNLDREQQLLRMGKYQTYDFTTYLNGCSWGKWSKYTNIRNIKLRMELEGNFKVTLVGYHLDIYSPDRNEFLVQEFNLESKKMIEIEFPDNSESIIGFEISTFGDCILYNGSYIGTYDEEDEREVVLSLATTTCKKEKFITSNMEILKKEIIESEDEKIRNYIYIHVIDNGRTLIPKEWNEPHLMVHPNKNTGGSGGFARGMLESLHQTPRATHVLLMDDDVLVLPESIKRTYTLLSLLKPEYDGWFISGAMLYYEEMNIQHEDIGTVCSNVDFCSLKPRLFHDSLKDNLTNELVFLEHPNEYAGWWYCCIPVSHIEKKGLPLPLFIRCDDIEYSLRSHAKIITMNGICIWHMGFVNKYNAAFDRYQQCRNLLIGKAATNIGKDVDMFAFWEKSFKAEILRFNYNAAELVLRALEDYMQGPAFIEQERGEQIVKENSLKNEKLVPLSELDVKEINFGDIYCDRPRKFIDKCIYHLTVNGQRFWPQEWLHKERAIIPFDHCVVTQRQTLRKELLAVNPHLKTGVIRKIDKKRFKEIYKRYKKDLKYYKKNHVNIEDSYREKAKYLVSEEFWMKYLDLN